MSKVKKAIILANISAITLVFIKVITWILTWSLAVLSSALDSLLDFFVSLFNLYVIKKSSSPKDEIYNYWMWKIQWIWALFEWIVVWSSWIVLIYFAVEKIISNSKIQQVNISIYMMIVSICITWALVYYLNKIYKETNNLTLKADTLHYKTDLYTNLWIIVSLIIIKITWMYVIDAIIWILIWCYILISSKEIIIEWYNMLMDKKINDEDINKIINIIKSTSQKITWYHMLKTRKSWDEIFIEFHIVFDKDIKLLEAHTIWDKVELKILDFFPNSNIFIHLDPFDDSSKDFCKLW